MRDSNKYKIYIYIYIYIFRKYKHIRIKPFNRNDKKKTNIKNMWISLFRNI